MEYIIVGDTEKHSDCLIYVCGKNFAYAENILDRMINSPTYNDKKISVEHKNLRIETVEDKDCWWRFECD